ncbi:hypothetical protein EDL57_18120 [Vibrio cholerae]|nr:hypothetical protein [Vibrio cholerae]EJL6306794.1 hypothetical protein [Vibrio cholerae]ELH0844265.1 hypothetical protein [Vibrio cholerae]
MKFLCHAGPWSDSYLSKIIKEIDNRNNSIILSAHKEVDCSGVIGLYYENLKKYKNKKFFTNSLDEDIILRCRLLRSLSKDLALLHLNSMRDAIREVIEDFNPDIVISETIDSYIMDILFFESKSRKIPFIGLVTVFLNGYFRISARGEYNFVRVPDQQEVLNTLELLEKKDYLPSFVQKDKVKPSKAILRKWIRNIVKIPYFSLKRLYSGDFYNYHYWQSVIVSKQWFHLFPKFEIGNKKWENELKSVDKTVIYVPLQMIPEATVDYWCDTTEVINYNDTLLEFIKSHSDLHFLIKEHPNVIGYRNPLLYKQLESQNNVTICPTQVHSNNLFNSYSAVLVWTGTVGFESALRGKPVLCLSHPYYFPDNTYFKLIKTTTTTKEINEYINSKPAMLSHEEKIKLVTHLLSGVATGNLKVDGTWDETSQNDFCNMKILAASLKAYIKSRKFNVE